MDTEPDTVEARQMKFGDIVLKKDEANGEEYLEWATKRGRARLAMALKMSIKDLSIQKDTKQVTGNVQCLASKNLFTGNWKRPNHQKVLSSWLFVTKEIQKI